MDSLSSSPPSRSSSFFTTGSSPDDATVMAGVPPSTLKDYGATMAFAAPGSNDTTLDDPMATAAPPTTKANIGALQADRPGYGTCSILSSSMNLVNAMMGSGIFGLPLALYLCGFWAGMVMSVVVAGLTCMAMHLLVLSGVRSAQYTLIDLCRVSLLGSYGAQAVNCMLVFHTAGTAVSYYILLGDMLPHLLGGWMPWFADRHVAVACFGLLFSLPLCLPRSVAPLAKWSTIGVLLLPLVLIGVAIRLPAYYTPFNIEWLNPSADQVFKGIAIMGLSFGCSQNVFGVFLSQRDQRPSRFLLADVLSVGISYMVNMTFGVLGFFCFAGHDAPINANALLNFPQDDLVINMVRLVTAIFIAITIPLSLHPCREALQKMLGHNTQGRLPTAWQHYTVTLVMFCSVLYLGATLTELGTVFAVIGGVSTTAIGLLLPGAAYMRIFLPELLGGKPFEVQADQNIKGSWLLMLGAFVLLIISMPIMYFAILDALL